MIATLLALLLAVVNSAPGPATYTCDAVTATYSVPFSYQTYTDLVVTSTTAGGVVTNLVYTTDYTVNYTSTTSTATLTLNNPAVKCPVGSTFKITRQVAYTQPYGFRQQTTYTPSLHETAYDRLEMQIQQLSTTLPTSITLTLKNQGSSLGPAATLNCLSNLACAIGGTDGSINLATNPSVAGTLGVTGATTLSSTLALSGNFSINTNKFTVASANGNTVVAGTLSSTGNVDVGTAAQGSSSATKTLTFNVGGFAAPGNSFTGSNGDKIVLYSNSTDTMDARIGIGSTSDLWYKASNAGGTAVHRFFTGNVPAERVRVSDGGLTVGSGGTSISKILHTTTTWNPGTIAGGGGTAGLTFTLTGLTLSSYCIAGVNGGAPASGHHVQCLPSADTCNIMIRCQQATNCVFGSATFWCLGIVP